jgi:Protein of unknown function (DUF3237)
MSRAIGTVLIAALVAISFTGIAHGQQASFHSTSSQTDVPHLEFVFEEFVTLGAGIHPGETPFGDRNIVPITGGVFSGPNIRGKVMPGGWDCPHAWLNGGAYIGTLELTKLDGKPAAHIRFYEVK